MNHNLLVMKMWFIWNWHFGLRNFVHRPVVTSFIFWKFSKFRPPTALHQTLITPLPIGLWRPNLKSSFHKGKSGPYWKSSDIDRKVREILQIYGGQTFSKMSMSAKIRFLKNAFYKSVSKFADDLAVTTFWRLTLFVPWVFGSGPSFLDQSKPYTFRNFSKSVWKNLFYKSVLKRAENPAETSFQRLTTFVPDILGSGTLFINRSLPLWFSENFSKFRPPTALRQTLITPLPTGLWRPILESSFHKGTSGPYWKFSDIDREGREILQIYRGKTFFLKMSTKAKIRFLKNAFYKSVSKLAEDPAGTTFWRLTLFVFGSGPSFFDRLKPWFFTRSWLDSFLIILVPCQLVQNWVIKMSQNWAEVLNKNYFLSLGIFFLHF